MMTYFPFSTISNPGKHKKRNLTLATQLCSDELVVRSGEFFQVLRLFLTDNTFQILFLSIAVCVRSAEIFSI